MIKNYFRLSAKLGAKHQIGNTNKPVVAFIAMALLFAMLPFRLFAQAPSISYSNNQTYITNAAITPLVPTISKMSVGPNNVAIVNLTYDFHNPLGVAVDVAGNVYVADNENNQVIKITPGKINPLIIGFGFKQPAGVAVDAAGNVFVADYGNDAVKKIPVGGGVPIVLGSGFEGPTGVAVDAKGNVYVADRSNDAIKKIPVGGGPTITIGSDFNYPSGVAVDPLGNVYVADYNNNVVKEILVNGGSTVILGSGFSHPNDVALDVSGNVYVADEANNAIKMIPASGGGPVIIGSGFKAPFGIAADASGNIYAGDAGNNAVKKIKPLVAYSINPALPTGLVLDNGTGIISGTPTAAIPATTYTITAKSSAGNNSAKVNITVLSVVSAPNISYPGPANYTTGITITPLAPAGNTGDTQGYIIIPALPTGLSFNNTTGIISGTPIAASAEKTYNITAYNSSGRNTVTVNITVTDLAKNPITSNDPAKSTTPANDLVTNPSPVNDPVKNAAPANNPAANPISASDPVTNTSPANDPAKNAAPANNPAGPVKPNGVGPLITTETNSHVSIAVSEPVVRQAVSPNGDGINDVLTIDNIQNYPDNKLTLMNRAGSEIYEITGYDNVTRVFDGHSNLTHALQQPGTYFYLLEYKVNGEVKHQTGFFILKY